MTQRDPDRDVATKTRALLFAAHPVFARVFCSPPIVAFFMYAAPAVLLLFIGSWAIGVHSIPTRADNLGFWYRYHWSLMHTVVIPGLFAGLAALSRQIRSCIDTLVEHQRIQYVSPPEGSVTGEVAIISAPSNNDALTAGATAQPSPPIDRSVASDRTASDYPAAVAAYIGRRSRWLTIGSIIFGVVVTAVDTKNLWPGFVTGSFAASRLPDWDTACTAATRWGSKFESPAFLAYVAAAPSCPENFAFDVVAYAFQTIALILGMFWLATFSLFLIAFARLLRGGQCGYRFDPTKPDIHLRLGLKPMGVVFETFLYVTVAIEVYALYHRLYLIALARHESLYDYLWGLSNRFREIPTETYSSLAAGAYDVLLEHNVWGLDGLDASALLTIVLMTVPIAIITFLPLFAIRKLVKRQRREGIRQLEKKYEEAVAARNNDMVQFILMQREMLEQTNIWPNGDKNARSFLVGIGALATGALLPPLLILVLVAAKSNDIRKHIGSLLSHSKKEGAPGP